jgi:hypothetical protein
MGIWPVYWKAIGDGDDGIYFFLFCLFFLQGMLKMSQLIHISEEQNSNILPFRDTLDQERG